MVGINDLGVVLQGYGAQLQASAPLFQQVGIVLLLGLLALVFPYIRQGLMALINGKVYGFKKWRVVGNDGHVRIRWANMNEDHRLYNDKAYIPSKKDFIINEFGEKEWSYVQDFTEPVKFVPYKRWVFIDKVTRQPLKDEKGSYVRSLNLVQFCQRKYVKQLELGQKIAELVEPKVLDDVVKDYADLGLQGVCYPVDYKEQRPGIDSALTAGVIIKRMKIESLNLLQKYWRQIALFGIIVVVGVIASAVLSYNLTAKVDNLRIAIDALAKASKVDISAIPK